ncbi:hypothetical protein [Prauserella endophytica]|uniref:hypothetical protein n=1 Tax=Prauserella endophytica TaxID=1592324 RepID=UPI000D842E3F|nr:hypothetical protein [Prauserella endophytica]PXY33009.1 hypothetical protein BAY59_07760 [Prauserella coralliicola]
MTTRRWLAALGAVLVLPVVTGAAAPEQVPVQAAQQQPAADREDGDGDPGLWGLLGLGGLLGLAGLVRRRPKPAPGDPLAAYPAARRQPTPHGPPARHRATGNPPPSSADTAPVSVNGRRPPTAPGDVPPHAPQYPPHAPQYPPPRED